MDFFWGRKTRGLSGFGGDGNVHCVGNTAAEGMCAGKMPAKSPSLSCIPQSVFHVTVVALCHLAVILELPGGQNKAELALHGLAGSGGTNVLTSLRERAGAARTEAFGLWSVPSSGHCALQPNCSFSLINCSGCISHLWVLSLSWQTAQKSPRMLSSL